MAPPRLGAPVRPVRAGGCTGLRGRRLVVPSPSGGNTHDGAATMVGGAGGAPRVGAGAEFSGSRCGERVAVGRPRATAVATFGANCLLCRELSRIYDWSAGTGQRNGRPRSGILGVGSTGSQDRCCLLYTSDAADDLLCVDLGGRRIIKK